MKKISLIVGVGAFAVCAAFAEREAIWPSGKMPDVQPHQVAAMLNEKKKGTEPYIDWCSAPAKPNGCCMILISGGGYNSCCDVGLVKTWEQMRRMGVASDLHTLCRQPHGFQRMASPGTGGYTWLGRVWEFMNHKGLNR